MIRAAIGVAPWDVLSQGIAAQPRSLGLATNVIGALVLLWWPLRQKPGVGTVLNEMLIGLRAVRAVAAARPSALGWQLTMFCAACWWHWPPACTSAPASARVHAMAS